ncbi:hypothetical protein niasHT_028374 [Heterodera trifolii]|uniref:Uncharacterized protein n=1 Tax=Heterodera trifolii TaxID=157864 RepID=A0ABD2JIM7_9BILA
MIAGISCVIDIIIAISAFIAGSDHDTLQCISVGVYWLILAFSCLMVIFARDNASLFLPYLVMKPALLVASLVGCIILVGLLLFAHSFVHNRAEAILLTIFVVVSLLCTALLTWFYFIIFRAYVELVEKSAPPDNANSAEAYGDVAAGPTYCCCGPCRARIETAIPVVALVGFLFQLNEACVLFFIECKDFCVVVIILGSMCLVSSIAYLLVLFAQRQHNPSLFLPYLIIMPIVMIIHWLDFALLLFDTFMLSSTSVLGLPVFIGLLLAFSVVPVLHKWFHAIIFRAYKKTKQQQQKSASFIANSSSRAEESRVGP